MNVDGDRVVFQHGHQRLGQLRVVVVGVGVDEVQNLGNVAPRGPRQPPPRREPHEAARGKPRQLAPLGHSHELFQEPARRTIGDRPIGQRRHQAAQPTQPVDARHQPIARRQAVGQHVQPLAFGHQLRNVDLAGHSSRHMWQLTHRSATDLNSSLVNVVGGSSPARMLRIRLALARGEALFGRREAKDRAHPHVGQLRSAGAAAVAIAGRLHNLLAAPIEAARSSARSSVRSHCRRRRMPRRRLASPGWRPLARPPMVADCAPAGRDHR